MPDAPNPDPWAEFRIDNATPPDGAAPSAADPWAEFRVRMTPQAPPQPGLLERARAEIGRTNLVPLQPLAELGARGINLLAQELPAGIRPAPRPDQPLALQPARLPFLGEPSATGMAKGLFQQAGSAYTLPGEVLSGQVDPLSPEGIARATQTAALLPTSIRAAVARRPATPALAAEKIEAQARKGYDALQEEVRGTPTQMVPSAEGLRSIAEDVEDWVKLKGPSEKLLTGKGQKNVYEDIRNIGKPRTEPTVGPGGIAHGEADVGDLIDSHKILASTVREGSGEEVRAAQLALERLDQEIEKIAPGTTAKLLELDKNYAIAKQASELESKIKIAGQRGEIIQTNVAKKVQSAIQSELEKYREKPYARPEVISAMEAVTKPGAALSLLRPIAGFDPTRSFMGLFANLLVHGGGHLATGGVGLPLHGAVAAGGFLANRLRDAIIRNRAEQVSEALRAGTPATLAQGGYLPGVVGMRPALPFLQPRLPLTQQQQP
jgi:hypothetical protein